MDIFVKYIELINKRSGRKMATTNTDVSRIYTISYNFS